MKSYDSGVQVQGHFEQLTGRSVSWATGVAIRGGTGAPTAQLSFPEGEQLLQLLVDGNLVDPSTKHEDSSARVANKNDIFEVLYTSTRLYVTMSKKAVVTSMSR